MLNLKKKLSALVPSESARSQLQNVLTVEWSGNKTVLVELPPASERSNDVEMAGLGPKGSGSEYGRLVDHDEEDEDEDVEWDGPAGGRGDHRFVQSRFDRARPDEPPASERYDGGSSFNIATSSSKPRAPNPFANPFLHDDDFAAGFSGTSSNKAVTHHTHAPRASSLSAAATAPPLPKRPTLQHPKNRSWDRGSASSRPFASPTHSTGGSSFSSSGTKAEDDPFR
ncbi:uncharacterized protein LOC62_01G000941 [Vanrija pseudolonga]|uniref:Uncharacterized protein n=1 Tax=Vanrija pseudolonga TaxID=143232 RepID=A0AAF1BF04_9TREE|nr:hypothetical protein LOC62_01G000941 [Vanrija pseudolonga]